MRQITGFGLIAVSLFMLLGFFNADLSESVLTNTFALLVTVGIPGAAGGYLLNQHYRSKGQLASGRESLRIQTQQSEVLRLAGELGGKVTVVEVMQDLALSQPETEELLATMERQEIAEIEITDDGLVVYNFPALRQLANKDKSKGILDA